MKFLKKIMLSKNMLNCTNNFKIGLITFHKANNIGAALQASALLKFINSIGIKCEIIDFIPNNSIKHHGNILYFLLRKSKNTLRFFIDRKSYKRISNFNKYYITHFVLSKKTYYGDLDIHNNPPKYDLLISGSDQNLNTTLSGKSTSYYLTFSEDTPKMSYASSFGRNKLTEDEYALISNELSKFDYLSVREASAGEIIENRIGRKPELVLDPVFLLEKEKWVALSASKRTAPYKNYIFVYSMEQSNSLEKAIDELKKQTMLPIVVVKGGASIGSVFDFEDKACGPSEFLRYILDAEYVVTNSFHGTAMSLIFGKKFVSVAHSSRNARLQNIMSLVASENKLIPHSSYNEDVLNYVNDGNQLYKLLEKYIDNSKKYLLSAIAHYKK